MPEKFNNSLIYSIANWFVIYLEDDFFGVSMRLFCYMEMLRKYCAMEIKLAMNFKSYFAMIVWGGVEYEGFCECWFYGLIFMKEKYMMTTSENFELIF